jgi:hypothetical protein
MQPDVLVVLAVVVMRLLQNIMWDSPQNVAGQFMDTSDGECRGHAHMRQCFPEVESHRLSEMYMMHVGGF